MSQTGMQNKTRCCQGFPSLYLTLDCCLANDMGMPINFLTFPLKQRRIWSNLKTKEQIKVHLYILTKLYIFSGFIFHKKRTRLFWTGRQAVYLSSITATYFMLVHHWHFTIQTSLGYANKIHGKVAATNASTVNTDSKTNRHRAVVQILRLLLRWGWTTVITILSASSSAMGRPSALMIKIRDALWLGLITLCRRTRSEIPLKQRAIQLTRRALCSSTSGRGRGTSSVCASSGFLSAASDTSASFCFLMNVRCRQMGQTIVSLIFPSLLMLTSVLTRQSWQNTCPQLSVLSVPDRDS